MTPALHRWLWQRGGPWLALLVPGLIGLTYLTIFDAPSQYVLVNGGALAFGVFWIAFGRLPDGALARRVLVIALLALLALPLLTDPAISNVTRWLPLGPLQMHSGFLAIPLLARLAAQDRDYMPPILLAAIFLILLQPDAASGFALMLAGVGLYFAGGDWKPGVVAILGFTVALIAAMRGVLPPQPFAERIIHETLGAAPLLALGIFFAMIATFFLMAHALPLTKEQRYAIAGSFAGFAITSVITDYPYPLVGYGASSLIGFALAMTVPVREAESHEKSA